LNARFSEIREADASGDIADIYRQLRLALRLPMVNLIYRHFATIPGGLPFVWSRLRTPLRDRSLDRARERLAQRPEIVNALSLDDRRLLRSMPVSGRRDVLAIVEFYNRGNLTNLIGLTAIGMLLEQAAPADGPLPAPASALDDVPVEPVPPLPRMDDLPADTASLVRSLAARHSGAASGITPSLYLHLGCWPDHLAAIDESLTPAFADGSVARAAETSRRLAQDEAAKLLPAMRSGPPPPDDVADALRAPIGLFTASVIPEMVPIGLALSRVLRANPGLPEAGG
jgi:hypothetical protein